MMQPPIAPPERQAMTLPVSWVATSVAITITLGSVLAVPAVSEGTPTDRPYCAARPGLGTTPCTIAPGHLSVEGALADWERDGDETARTDSVLVGGVSARFGVRRNVEVSLDWTPWGSVWIAGNGLPTRQDQGVGDLTLGAKINLRHPDGSGLSFALLPFLGLPTGGRPMGARDWSAGLVAPASLALGRLSLQLTPEIDLDADEDAPGRHLSYRMVGGATVAISGAVSVTQEMSLGRRHEGDREVVQSFAATSLAYLARDNLQFDGGAVFGLTAQSPDARFYVGVSHLF